MPTTDTESHTDAPPAKAPTFKVGAAVSWTDDAEVDHAGLVVAVTPAEGDVPAKYDVAELPPATGRFFGASLKAV